MCRYIVIHHFPCTCLQHTAYLSAANSAVNANLLQHATRNTIHGLWQTFNIIYICMYVFVCALENFSIVVRITKNSN